MNGYWWVRTPTHTTTHSLTHTHAHPHTIYASSNPQYMVRKRAAIEVRERGAVFEEIEMMRLVAFRVSLGQRDT